ncbi:bifunctional DNA primase/polymerase [Streptomyces sp. NEAU-H22]|uniref:bifunctional DNA primase/polymerase n=1 Tax=unclassified Streptomyces TaxID=2593676 RepID=UPI00224E4679|nr:MULTISPECIES: bifunctional DNA primase/polymerase [unclassified Streptomyces]MCX3286093.1 bifunctional DNA primase/polymerase [Streptomyces sp. NEAU-H22]WMD08941.1 bifunctional DNA primase/polymerase [Streptomyces sp. FXY-T5]
MSSAWNASDVTPDGAAWLASAGTYPRSTLALWEERPDAPVVLPCGSVFDVVSAPAMFGRRMLDRLWDDGPGSGPVAQFRGRMLLFAAPGTAQRLPALLEWEEWGARCSREATRTDAVPPLLCHGTGDAVTVPAPSESASPAVPAPSESASPAVPAPSESASPAVPAPSESISLTVPASPGSATPAAPPPAGAAAPARSASRWLVAPDTRQPWLPGPEVLLWAAVRAARSAVRISIFPPADQDAKVYDVSRRR